MVVSKNNIITLSDTPQERITCKWDGERFGIVKLYKADDTKEVTVLNPREAQALATFIQSQKGVR